MSTSDGDLSRRAVAIDESWYVRPPGVSEHVSAGGIVARREAGRIYIALTREGDAQGYILPKGHVEPNEDVERAARREIQEETGLADLTLLADLGVQERLDYERSSWKKTRYFLYVTTQREGTPSDPTRDYVLEWFPLDALPPMFWPEQRELIETNRDRIAGLLP